MINYNSLFSSVVVAILLPLTIQSPWYQHRSTTAAAFVPGVRSLYSTHTTRLHSSTNDNVPPLTRLLDDLSKTNILSNRKSIMEKELVVAKCDIPRLGIYGDQMYELQSIFLKGKSTTLGVVDTTTGSSSSGGGGIVDKIPLQTLDLTNQKIPPGYTLYITLYSPMYHDDDGCGVIVTPQEVGIVTMKDEIADSIMVALPLLMFTLTLSSTFASIYQERYGGSFLDAFWGT